MRRRHAILGGLAASVAITRSATALPRWLNLPATPTPAAMATSYANVNGIRLFFADSNPQLRNEEPIIMLHGGLANSDYFGQQVRALAYRYRIILVDSRGHGRSSRNAQPFSYDIMTDDVIALMDALDVPRARLVGWSDGAIIGLDMAIRRRDRVSAVFAFGANTRTTGLKPDVEHNPTFARFIARSRVEYSKLSATPHEYDAFVEKIEHMWASQPNWTDEQLRTIQTPVLIADGQYDEAIQRIHTEYMAATISSAGLLILPNVSHFAFLQDPDLFNSSIVNFFSGLS